MPSDKHRLDAKTWKDRYPEIQVAAPEGARPKVEETVQVDTVAPDFEDPNVQFVTVPGTRGRESALVVRKTNGRTLVLNVPIDFGKPSKQQEERDMSLTGSCHCGKTVFRTDAEIPTELTRCTCSFCAKRGALLAYCKPDQFHVKVLPADDSIYRWQTRQVAHHYSPAFEPDGKWDGSTRRIGVNARLFDDFDAALAKIVVIDGKHLW